MTMECVIDIEADSLDPTVIHCIVAKDTKTGEVYKWREEECTSLFPSFASNVTKFIGHNIISFDMPVLNRLAGTNIKITDVEDTLVLSQILNPIRDGGHSLEDWGKRLGFPKHEFNDFSAFSQKMLEYCTNDVELCFRLWIMLSAEATKISRKSIELEYRIRAIIDEQEENGFSLDHRQAMLLVAKLEDKASEIQSKVLEIFKPLPTEVRLVTPKYKKDGSLSSVGLGHIDDLTTVEGPHTSIEFVPFNLASRQQIVRQLMLRGWKPEKFTEKGSAIVDESVLNEVDIPEAKLIAEYLLLEKRVTQIKSWIELVKDDGKVHGSVLTLRTISGRMAHTSPNIAQVPASYSPYGHECRSCWTASKPSHSLVGCDASSLELRVLAHYLNDPKFTSEVVDGDIHTANQKAAGLDTRDQAKTFIYAFIYGAGPAKIGSIVGGDAKVGQQLIDKFLTNVPKISIFRKRVDIAAKRGYLIGIDGRRLIVRNAHAAMNLLIQGGGAVVCKQWLVQIRDRVAATKLDARLVASIHDEYQHDVLTEHAKDFGELTKEAMKDTQKILDFRCRLDSEYKIGKTWAETH